MLRNKKLRIARPTQDLKAIERFYCNGLGFELLGKFEDHAGIDGIMVGHPGSLYHFEFTRHRDLSISPTPTTEDLVVFYVADDGEWTNITENLSAQGFESVRSNNPYWDNQGRTYQDSDGYRVVIQKANWSEST